MGWNGVGTGLMVGGMFGKGQWKAMYLAMLGAASRALVGGGLQRGITAGGALQEGGALHFK